MSRGHTRWTTTGTSPPAVSRSRYAPGLLARARPAQPACPRPPSLGWVRFPYVSSRERSPELTYEKHAPISRRRLAAVHESAGRNRRAGQGPPKQGWPKPAGRTGRAETGCAGSAAVGEPSRQAAEHGIEALESCPFVSQGGGFPVATQCGNRREEELSIRVRNR